MEISIDCIVTVRVKPGRAGKLDDRNYASWVQVERRDGIERTRWAVTDMGLVLAQNGEWEFEPIPSSRDEDFLERCRFDSFDEALAAARMCKVYQYEKAAPS